MKYCTNCGSLLKDKNGQPYGELTDEDMFAKTGIIKLLSCQKCDSSIADKYLEYDGTLLLIDLALQSKQAYRHVLLNGQYVSLVFKMTILTVICDGYVKWLLTSETSEFFEQEFDFYISCLKVVVGKSLF